MAFNFPVPVGPVTPGQFFTGGEFAGFKNPQGFMVSPEGKVLFGITKGAGGPFSPAATALTPELRAAIMEGLAMPAFEFPEFDFGSMFEGFGSFGGGFGGGFGGTPRNAEAEKLLLRLFKDVMSGTPDSAVGNTLLRLIVEGTNPFITGLSEGKIPPELKAAFDDQLGESLAGIRESFGSQGARFGTDLGRVLGEQAGRAHRGFAADVIERALGAESLRRNVQLGGLGRLLESVGIPVASFQFGREEAALNRALQEFLARQQNDPLAHLFKFFLGGA